MTPDQEKHLKEIKDFFVQAVDAKYRAGQAEHGGNLWDRNVTQDIKLEAIDLVTYIYTAMVKQEQVLILLSNTLTELNTNKNLIFARKRIQEAITLLEGKQ